VEKSECALLIGYGRQRVGQVEGLRFLDDDERLAVDRTAIDADDTPRMLRDWSRSSRDLLLTNNLCSTVRRVEKFQIGRVMRDFLPWIILSHFWHLYFVAIACRHRRMQQRLKSVYFGTLHQHLWKLLLSEYQCSRLVYTRIKSSTIYLNILCHLWYRHSVWFRSQTMEQTQNAWSARGRIHKPSCIEWSDSIELAAEVPLSGVPASLTPKFWAWTPKSI
jgi:hypothetical protein